MGKPSGKVKTAVRQTAKVLNWTEIDDNYTEQYPPDTCLLHKKDVARILGVTARTIEKLMKRKEISYVKIGASVRYDRNDINRFIDSKKVRV